jgi:hypothetical protein
MALTIFFSWQSDRPKREGRNFIDKCLQEAIKNVSLEIEFQEAMRGQIEMDSDTKTVPGSPKIFPTILKKIEKATIFVPDLTFVAMRPNNHPVPNPNVLIEYGYALKALGEYRIIAVMNAAYGAPSRDTMPFDLIEHRNPITYNLPESADDATRTAQCEQLIKIFEVALKTFFESDEYRDSLPKPAPVAYREPKEGRARFRAKGEPIGLRSDPFARITGGPQGKLFLTGGPSMWLRVGPQFPSGKPHKVKEIERHATKLAVLPFYDPGGSIGGMQGPDGSGFYDAEGPEPTSRLVYAFTDSEVWSINNINLSLLPDLILFEEEKLVQSLDPCVDFLKGLGIPGPYHWVAGVEGVLNRYLRQDAFGRKSGTCQIDLIESEGFFKAGDDPKAVLEPFFEEVYDKCGLDRPVMTVTSQ